MVRLKGFNLGNYENEVISFNSTMVRLKEKEGLCGIFSAVFQFHYGTIKRNRRHTPYPAEGGFNSTMVRLKASILEIAEAVEKVSIPLWYD